MMSETFYSLKRETEQVSEEERIKQKLFACMLNGDMDTFDSILPLIDVNDQKTKPLRSALSMACQVEETRFAVKLLNNGANPNLQDQLHRTPLMECCLKGDVSMASLLLQNIPSANKNLQDNDGRSSLFGACQKGHLDIVKLLLSAHLNPVDEIAAVPCDVNLKNKEGKTPLYVAIENNHQDVVAYLLEHANCDVNCVTQNGITVLMRACTKGSVEIVKLLLNYKYPPDINHLEPTTNKTCIMMAAHKKYNGICTLLLEHKQQTCNLWQLTSEEKSIMDFAKKNLDPKVVRRIQKSLLDMISDAVSNACNDFVPSDVIAIVAKSTY